MSNTSITAQCKRFEAELRQRPVDSDEARHELQIYAPFARVHDLRWKCGLNVQMRWISKVTVDGAKRRIGQYYLLPGKWKGDNNV